MNFKHINILLAFFLLSFSNTHAQTFSDPEDLEDAVYASANGGLFIVKNGNYNDFEATFEIKATANNPVIIKAETIGGVVLTGESHLSISLKVAVLNIVKMILMYLFF